MGYWVNLDRVRNTAHRDDIVYEGIYENCRPQEEKIPPWRWVHIDADPQFAPGSTVMINVNGSLVRVRPCGNCHPW